MAAMSVGAGIAVKSVLPQLKGSISVFGTPAEEGGGGKVIMLENGAFDGVDAAMIIHSANETVVNDISYSRTDIIVDFSEREPMPLPGLRKESAPWIPFFCCSSISAR